MKFLSYTLVLLNTVMAYNYGHHRPLRRRDFENRVYYAVELQPGINPDQFLRSRGDDWEFEQNIGSLENHYLFSVHKDSEHAQLVEGIRDQPVERVIRDRAKNDKNDPHMLRKRSEKILYKREMLDNGVVALQVLEPKQLHKRAANPAPPPPPADKPPVDSSLIPLENAIKEFGIHDPEFRSQWHLINSMEPGNDLNITGVWKQGITGKNAMSVAVVDDGLDMEHEDLKHNYFPEGSYDFNGQRPEPRPELSNDRHGTRCAGEIAAVKNDVCGIGVAYDGKVSGIRILSAQISEADEALSLNYAMDKNAIYSCSWGPPDDGQSVVEPGMLVRKAIMNAVQHGRDKKGSIYVFASGNGALNGDNCNFDGYTNSIYSITVAAIDKKGIHPVYSEACSANMVVTYSSGSNDHIHTTDFHGGCTDRHGGTSAAAPIAAGVFSLVLEARPELTWRDVQYLSMDTAQPVNEHEEGWQTTEVGKKYHHKYGYGKLDAYAIVERAKEWELVKPQAWHFHERETVEKPIKYGEDKCVESTVEITKEALEKSNFDRVEHVNVYMNIEHERRGVLSARLKSPSGVISNILEPRFNDDSPDGLIGWTVMSVAHWGEKGVGNWTMTVCNTERDLGDGEFKDWRLKLWGESKDAEKAMLFPIPNHDDPDPDHRGPSAAIPSPTEHALPHSSKSQHEHSSKATSSASISLPSGSNSPSPVDGGRPTKPSDDVPEAEATTGHPWTLIPTFGLSSHTLAWVYGSIFLIAGFVACITIYICISRRKRNQESRGYKANPTVTSSYEFDLIPAHDSDSDGSDDERRIYDSSELHYHHDSDSIISRDSGNEGNGSDRLTVGKKARTLYDAPQMKSEENSRNASRDDVFAVGDDEDDEQNDESKLLQH